MSAILPRKCCSWTNILLKTKKKVKKISHTCCYTLKSPPKGRVFLHIRIHTDSENAYVVVLVLTITTYIPEIGDTHLDEFD